jgi:MinD-like ATPase involved in chromosome partitioning or flagellar assembly
VLLVDFDLEAPGLDTIPDFASDHDTPGVVDYLSHYIRTGTAPSVRDYIYRTSQARINRGEVWIMRSGRRDEQYGVRLAEINWRRLYEEMDGFLLLDDLKRQWEEVIAPDYVLIDSRTGHTEVSGICTRQLPDANVLLFIPNHQNLSGLEQVVRAIRAEGRKPDGRSIQTLFVPSNVPDLDDDEEILERLLSQFSERLNYHQPDAVIHRYDSLSLLNQSVFVVDRPTSRLAKEYKTLAGAIVEKNLDDREGALRFLRAAQRSRRNAAQLGTLEDKMQYVRKRHAQDADVLFEVSKLLRRYGKGKDAIVTLDQVSSIAKDRSHPLRPRVLLERAEGNALAGARNEALADVMEVLETPGLDPIRVRRAIAILSRFDLNRLRILANMPALRSLDLGGKLQFISELGYTREGQFAAAEILLPSLPTAGALYPVIRSELSLCLIGLRRFREAVSLFGDPRPPPEELDVASAFNMSIAEWGLLGSPPADMFHRVIELDASEESDEETANYEQCLALSHYALGHRDAARQRLYRAQERLTARMVPEFSCWRYLRVIPEQLHEDLREMDNAFDEHGRQPPFFRSTT